MELPITLVKLAPVMVTGYPPAARPLVGDSAVAVGAAGGKGSTARSSKAKLPPSPTVALLDTRSEEHTSELQSPCNLVCRLLLEKRKYRVSTATTISPFLYSLPPPSPGLITTPSLATADQVAIGVPNTRRAAAKEPHCLHLTMRD